MNKETKVIDKFWGRYYFLSNFFPAEVEIEGIIYPTSEHAFQAMKTSSVVIRKMFASIPQDKPGKAKHFGRQVKLRPRWNEIKIDEMRKVITAKFSQDLDLAYALVETHPAKLIEGNDWGDTFWGVCNGEGYNNLGKILEEVRKGLIIYE